MAQGGCPTRDVASVQSIFECSTCLDKHSLFSQTTYDPVSRFEDGDPPVEEDPVHEDPFRRDARDAVVPPMHSQSFWDKSAPRNRPSVQLRKPTMPSVFATRRRTANGGPLHPRDLGISPGRSLQPQPCRTSGANCTGVVRYIVHFIGVL